MFKICMAQLNILIDNKYSYIENMCTDYITDAVETDFAVSVTDAEIMAEDDGTGFDAGYLESLAIYRKIAEEIISYDGFLMHGVVIDVCSKGVMFTAKSGVGKTTHTRLWQQLLNEKMTVVNGDKPLIRIIDEKIFAYGSPWAGKEGMHKNMRAKLGKVCFLERSEVNKCYLIEKDTVLEKLLPQIYVPKDALKYLKTLDLLSRFIDKVEFYKTECNMDLSAAEIAYKEMIL